MVKNNCLLFLYRFSATPVCSGLVYIFYSAGGKGILAEYTIAYRLKSILFT